MRTEYLVILVCFLAAANLSGQSFFPVKIDKKWGLMDSDGKIVLDPVYDAIGEFKSYGYAVMQRKGGVGLLGRNGRELLPPSYEDLKVLTPGMIAVLSSGRWQVIDLYGNVLIEPGYDQLRVLEDGHLAFQRNRKWGLVNSKGQTILPPLYDAIEPEENGFFHVWQNDQIGLVDYEGLILLEPQYDEIRIHSSCLFFVKKNNLWGLSNGYANRMVTPAFTQYNLISEQFIRFFNDGKSYLYSIDIHRMCAQGQYDNFYIFADDLVLCKRNRLLGLLNQDGELILKPRYREIQRFGPTTFRVNLEGRWGLVGYGDSLVLDFQYEYIAPLKDGLSIVKQAGKTGLVNPEGDLVISALYERMQVEQRLVKAYIGDELTLYHLDEQGRRMDAQNFSHHFSIRVGKRENLLNERRNWENLDQYVLDSFEWFYSSEADKWGLRRLSDGQIQIEPLFDRVQVYKQWGFTLVGMDISTTIDFERTTYRFASRYGLVNNEVGLLVSEVGIWDVRLSDFEQGYPAARCILSSGRHGLIARNGKMLCKDYAYIGDFREGLARVSVRGRLSGSMNPDGQGLGKLQEYLSDHLVSNYMLDFTAYDVEFQKEAQLVCEDCLWGYMDTLGNIRFEPQFSFANDIVNEVGIVASEEKWGLVGINGQMLIPCQYDWLEFLDHTDNKMLRVYKKEEKYGLIDTLGQLKVQLTYDEIGSFSEGRLAVKRNGLWGFVDRNGLEVIPCRFRAVSNFSEGLAAAKLGRQWGFIDKQGNVEIDFQFIRTGNFSNGLAWFFDSARYGYINRQGQVAIAPGYEKACDFEQGMARIMLDNKYGLIDVQGQLVMKPKYILIEAFNSDGQAKVCYGSDRIRYGIINQLGELVTQTSGYSDIGPFSEGLASVKTKDGYGFIDRQGRLIIPAIYSKVSVFKEGLAAVQREGLCGYIDAQGNERVGLNYTRCLDFEDGTAVVYHGYRRAGLINPQGQFLIEPSIDRMFNFTEGRGLVRDQNYRFYYITEQAGQYNNYYDDAGLFKHGVAVVQSNGRWGIINQRGMEIIPPKYDKIEQFEDGYAKVRIQGFNGLTNLRGELIIQPDYEYISYAGDGLFRVEKGDKVGYFDMEGNWVWGLQE